MNNPSSRARAHEALERAYASVPAFEVSRYRVNTRLYREVLERLLEQFGDLHGKRILDVGAGRGILTLAIRFLGAETHALEKYVFNHETSSMFKEGDEQAVMAVWKQQGILPFVEDLFDLERVVSPNSYDAIVNVEVIEHLKAPKQLVDQIRHALKPGGFVVIATPNYGRLHARLRLFFGKNPKLDLEPFYLLGDEGFIGHWREYLPDELAAMLRLSGFQHIKTDTFCDPLYAIKKRVSLYSITQTVIHFASYLIPNGRYELIATAVKPS